jgi:hypothetical protein
MELSLAPLGNVMMSCCSFGAFLGLRIAGGEIDRSLLLFRTAILAKRSCSICFRSNGKPSMMSLMKEFNDDGEIRTGGQADRASTPVR